MSPGPERRIESAHNPALKDLRRLLTRRGIRKQGLAVVSGERLVLETLRALPGRCRSLVVSSRHLPLPVGFPAGLIRFVLAPELFRTLDALGTDAPLLVLAVEEPETWDPAQGLPPGLSVLVPFQDPENVGAVIRSAAAFGAANVILLEGSAHPFLPRALRASGGAVLRTRLRRGPALEVLPSDLPVVPLSGEGRDIGEFVFPSPCALLPGEEGEGLPETWRERAVAIPIRPEVESLNAAVATSIALYLWSRHNPGSAPG